MRSFRHWAAIGLAALLLWASPAAPVGLGSGTLVAGGGGGPGGGGTNPNLVSDCSTFNTPNWTLFNSASQTNLPTFGSLVADPNGVVDAQQVSYTDPRDGMWQVFNPPLLPNQQYTATIDKKTVSGSPGIFEGYYSGESPVTQYSSLITPSGSYGRTAGFTFRTNGAVTTGNFSSGSAIVTAIPATGNMLVGENLVGANVPANATLSSIDSGTQIHMSANAVGTLPATGAAITASDIAPAILLTNANVDGASQGHVGTMVQWGLKVELGTTATAFVGCFIPNNGLNYLVGFDEDNTNIAHIETLMGRNFNSATGFQDRGSWAGWESPMGNPNFVSSGTYPKYWTTLSMVLFPTEDGVSTAAAAGAGSYNSHYANFANNLVTAGYGGMPTGIAPNAGLFALNIHWEFNDGGAETQFDGDPDDYVKAWRALAAAIKAKDSVIKLCWVPNNGLYTTAGDAITKYYPGDDVVDCIGMDWYEGFWGSWSNSLGSGSPGPGNGAIAYLDALSKQTVYTGGVSGVTSGGAKPMVFSEWQTGTSNTTQDSGAVTSFAAWVNARNARMLYINYWNSTAFAPGYPLVNGSATEAAFVAAWAGTSYTGSYKAAHP